MQDQKGMYKNQFSFLPFIFFAFNSSPAMVVVGVCIMVMLLEVRRNATTSSEAIVIVAALAALHGHCDFLRL